ncbi:hypothetical protein [Campylobacter sp.]|uniref:hypothetical protein n=1 Tax=Campylobacter sp. TaxID=205 RepID=UPI002710B2C3|nr:hypothetical protein [Campylobacter sp.]
MNIKKCLAITCVAFSLLLTGCRESTSYTLKLPTSELERINLPKSIELDGSNFTLKGQNLTSAEFYLENEQGFNWSKLVTVTFSSKADIKSHKQAFENSLKSGKFGDTKFELKFISDSEYNGYTIYFPIKGDKKFDNYEINLIQTKKLSCGLAMTHYAVKFKSDTDEKTIKNFIDKKLSKISSEFPNITCR